MTQQHTIAAIATPYGTGGLAVIRVSGGEAIAVCGRIFKTGSGKPLSESASHTVQYGHVHDPESGETVDEGMAAVFRAPRSFTTEDTVELTCHGGILVTRRVLDCVLRAGAHLAEPGEFTKRAFLGGRLDLAQAEAVIDVINAKTNRALETASSQLGGGLSDRIQALRGGLLDLCARLNALVDFPEEDIETMTAAELSAALEQQEDALCKLYASAHTGRLIRDGINTVILGKPNVGKSSLLNALAGENRAIVTDIAGTTRDVVTESVDIGGVALNIFDTAGIRESDDQIERIGIDKSRQCAAQADLVLLVLDGSGSISSEDKAACGLADGKRIVAVVNKTDLGGTLTAEHVREQLGAQDVAMLSAKSGDGVDALRKQIMTLFSLGEIAAGEECMLTNLRQQEAVRDARAAVARARDALASGIPMDMVSVDLLSAVSSLGEISGKTVTEEMVDRIFSQFCLGK